VPFTLTAVPAGLVLGAIALAERAGAETVVFYLFLLGIAVSATGGLAGFGRLVDVANGDGTPALGRFQAGLAAALVGVFLVGAVARSPVVLELGAPGLAPAAVVLGFLVLGLQAIAAVVLSGR
jgi:hypothetical protein